MNSLLAGVTNAKKRKQIIKDYARRYNLPTASETDSDFENEKEHQKKPKWGRLNIKDFAIKRRKKKKRVFKCPVCKKKKN